jgi:protein-tyrosine-phosphatase
MLKFVISTNGTKRSMWCRVILAAVVVLSLGIDVLGQATAKTRETTKRGTMVVFVCEHGSAKSVIAAAHFNNLAKAQHLKLRAISRGTNPDREIAPKAAAGLEADGLAVDGDKPKRLSKADVSRSIRVVAFCELPEAYKKGVRVEQWTDVPAVSEDYQKAREAIVEHIKRLLDELR